MEYEKPVVEVVRFDAAFMTLSGDYSTPSAALQSACGSFSGQTNNFTCGSFGGYSAANPPPQNAQVSLADGLYVFDYKGNHWKLHK